MHLKSITTLLEVAKSALVSSPIVVLNIRNVSDRLCRHVRQRSVRGVCDSSPERLVSDDGSRQPELCLIREKHLEGGQYVHELAQDG